MTILVVVPARWGSTRFPGKPLAMIAGRTLLHRAIDLGRRSLRDVPQAELVVATDDERIFDHARGAGCSAVMTDAAIDNGSARALAAAKSLRVFPDHVVNLQGDAPFVPPDTIMAVLAELVKAKAQCVTPVVRLSWPDLDALRTHKIGSPASGTTCIRGADGTAIWFSKQIIPLIRNEAAHRAAHSVSPIFRHLGIYGYSLSALERFVAAEPSLYETLEGLEQLRLIEIGIPVGTVEVEPPLIAMGGIDTPEDVRLGEALIARHGDPFGT